MKRIVYQTDDGAIAVVAPIEGSRLAYGVTLADGSELRNTVLITPEQHEIIAASPILDERGNPQTPERIEHTPAVYQDEPLSADRFLRRWPVEGATADWAETEEAFIARVAKKLVPEGVEYVLVDESELPGDRTFRDAWTNTGAVVSVHMPAALEIAKNQLRGARKPLFQDLDIAYQRADVRDDVAEKIAVEGKRQVLRDITTDALLAGAQDPEELKAAIDELTTRMAEHASK